MVRTGLWWMVVCCGLATLLAATAAGASSPLGGKLVYLQGQVEVRRAGSQQWQAAQINLDLFAGDAVQTGALSRAAILCVDESQIKLNENTYFLLKAAAPSPRLQLGEVVPAALKEAARSLYEVTAGEIWLRNKNEKARFEMETPAVTAAIRGTEFNLRVAADGATSVTLLEGSLRLANAQGELGLAPGEEGLARPGLAPTKRILVQPADAVQWSLYYPGIFSYRDLSLAALRGLAQPRNGAQCAPYLGAGVGCAPRTTTAAGNTAAVSALVEQGEAAYDQGRLEEARENAAAALQKDPQNDRALTLLGWISLQDHNSSQARDYFRRVGRPDGATMVGLALASYRLGDAAAAYEIMAVASRQLRPTPVLRAMEGYFALLAGRVAEARSRLEAALQAAPNTALPRCFLAQIHLVQNRKETARREAALALAASPDSPLAQLTVALVDIAYFDLPAAGRHLEQALKADPRFVDAYVYLAKIQLGGDYLTQAWKTIQRALKLAPQEGEVLTLAGFIRLGFRDYSGAFQLLNRAVRVAPALGEPHLGLGIYQFRYREYRQGLTEMLTATLLEPRISLYQSSLGKALYQVRAFDKALEVYDYAKTLDPRDPTPYLYKGIALTDLNRPGEAIEEINRSIALNDNTAVFRSRLMLDRDLAVRNYNLSRAYNLIGLGEWAYSQAVTAVKNDPTNSSAHLFLASAFLNTGQRTGAAGSELLLYRMLSPANQNTFTVYNDYTPMFEAPYLRVQAIGGVGAGEKRSPVQDHSLEVYGGQPGLAGYAYGSYFDDRGFRQRNGDLSNYSSINIAKWEPTVQNSLLASYFYNDSEFGDRNRLHEYYFVNDPNMRQFTRNRRTEGGYVHRFGPNAIFMGYFVYGRSDYHFMNNITTPDVFRVFGIPVDQYDFAQLRRDQEFYNAQVQQQVILGNHTFIGGFDYYSGHLKDRFFDFQVFNLRGTPLTVTGTLQSDFQPPNHSYTFYLLDYWHLTNHLTAELGLFKDFTKNSRVGHANPISTSLWSPRLGLNYQVNSRHTLRLALQRHLTTHNRDAPLLVPGEVASFPWQFNIDDGSMVREAGLAWEAQWNPRTFTVLRLDGMRVDTPQFIPGAPGDQQMYIGYKRYLAHLTLNRILYPYLGLAAGVIGKRVTYDQGAQFMANPDFKAFNEFDAFLTLSFLHRTGWQATINGWVIQQRPNDRDNNVAGIVNLRFGKEFDNKRGFFSLDVSNLFNRHFFYLREPVTFEPFLPVRQIMFRLGLYY